MGKHGENAQAPRPSLPAGCDGVDVSRCMRERTPIQRCARGEGKTALVSCENRDAYVCAYVCVYL